MKVLVTLVFLTICSICYSQIEYRLLKKSYELDSMALYEGFLNIWHADSKPRGELHSLRPKEKDIYILYEDFQSRYREQMALRYPDKDYSLTEYFVSQRSLYTTTYAVDDLDFDALNIPDSLDKTVEIFNDFRPIIHMNSVRVLHKLPKYEAIIKKFLGVNAWPGKKTEANNHFGPLGPFGVKGREERDRRHKFLNRILSVHRGIYARNWFIDSDLSVNINFNKDRTIAWLLYYTAQGGGQAMYIKVLGEWQFKHYSRTFIGCG